jgi:hypothetical protein
MSENRMQTVIHFPQSSGISQIWYVNPTDDQDFEDDDEKYVKDQIDRTSDETIIESIRRIDTLVFGEGEPWEVKGIAHTPNTTIIEAFDPIVHYIHTYTIIW